MMLLTPGMAAFDMDGTLLNEASQMSKGNREALLKLQETGCKLVLSTGRMFGSAQIPIDSFPFDGYVCSNGAALYEKDGTLIRRYSLAKEMVIGAIHALRQDSEPVYYEMHDTNSNRWMVQEDRDRLEPIIEQGTSLEGVSMRRFALYRLAKVVPLEEMLKNIETGEAEIVKFFIWESDAERLKWIADQFAAWKSQISITSSGSTNIEINSHGVSKWEGLRHFCQLWGIAPEKVMAFGDAENDREALTEAGYSVAMENASSKIKEIAKFVAPHHNEDGVAQFIWKHVLGETPSR